MRLQEEQERRLGAESGGYYNAAAADDLLARGKELFDGAMPAANAVAALNLLDLHAATGDARHRAAAERTLRAFAPIVATHPDGARTLTLALSRFASLSGVTPSTVDAVAEGAPGRTEAPEEEQGPEDPSLATAGFSDSGLAALASPRLRLDPESQDGSLPFVLQFRVKSGWHLPVETELPRLLATGAKLEGVEWPSAMPLATGARTPDLPSFVGVVEVRGRLRQEAPRATLALEFVACGEERCHPPARIEIAIPRDVP
jgi:hypothetical protein